MSHHVEVTPDLLAGFLDEAPGYLSALEEGLLAFEEQARGGSISLRTDADHDRMNQVFRAAHSLKGIAASLGFDRIRELTHVMESLFDQLRNAKLELNACGVESLFRAVDTLRRLIDELSQPADPPASIDEALAAMNGILTGAGGPGAAPPDAKPCDETRRSSVEAEALRNDAELLTRFVETTVEAIDQLNQHLLVLEEQPENTDVINEVFRCAHNIKGASGAVGLGGMMHFTHEMETVLDRVRAREVPVDGPLVAALFQAVDHLRGALDLVTQQRFEQIDDELPLDLFASWSADARADQPAGADAGRPAVSSVAVRVTFRQGDPDTAILACILYNRLAEFAKSISANPDVFALDGNAEVREITYRLETNARDEALTETIRAYGVEDIAISRDGSDAGSRAPSPRTQTAQPQDASSDAAPGAPPQRTAPAPEPRPASVPDAPRPRDAAPAARTGETIRVDLERLDQLMNLGGELVITKARFGEIGRKLSAVFSQRNVNYLVDDIADRLAALRGTCAQLEANPDSREVLSTLSDAALHLAADFETIRGPVRRLHAARGTMAEFGEAMHGLNRICEGMQRRIMQTRMVAIGPLFQRFRRAVRDMCKTTGKKVELHLHGENTELDKRMIDELVDPLTHMVRNSVDHGIELPEDRRAAGKPETGRLVLDAFHRGRHICIEVTDDGKGLDVARIRRKIVERELATAAQADQMSDHEAMQYIFRPGFSTAEKVSDLSGRGMGMDIVRTRIEALNGSVEMDSNPGQGTRFTIALPLTLAIIPAMMIRIGRCAYAVPLETVVEITTVSRADVRHIQRQAAIRLRDRVIPLTVLERVLRMGHDAQRTQSLTDKSRLTVMVLGMQNERLGLIVDDLMGQEDIVIKDVASNFHNVEGIAGASIMGDGSVSLILDVAALMSSFARRGAQKLLLEDAPAPLAAACGERS